MSSRFLLLCVGFFVASCSSRDESWSVVVDRSMNDAERSELLLAARAWEEAVPCPVRIRVVPGDVGDAFPDDDQTITVRVGVPPRGSAGWTQHGGRGRARIVVRAADVNPDDYQRVLRHELGHGFGLTHTANGVMADPPKLGAEIERVDVEAFRALWCE